MASEESLNSPWDQVNTLYKITDSKPEEYTQGSGITSQSEIETTLTLSHDNKNIQSILHEYDHPFFK